MVIYMGSQKTLKSWNMVKITHLLQTKTCLHFCTHSPCNN